MTTDNNDDDVLILTDKDLYFYNPKICKGTTLKGKQCRNKIHKEFDYCKLHREKFRLEKPEECPICMENLDDVHVPLSCSHWVHRKCILNWGKNCCPICREDIKMTAVEKRKIQKKHRDNGDYRNGGYRNGDYRNNRYRYHNDGYHNNGYHSDEDYRGGYRSGGDNYDDEYDDDSDYDDIILPPQLLEFFNSLIRSHPESIRDGMILNVDFDDNGMILINSE